MKKVIFSLLMLIILILLIWIIYGYIFRQKVINFEKVGEVYSSTRLTGSWWFVVQKSNDSRVKMYNISLPEIDFQKNNLIISAGREIKKIMLKREKTFPFDYSHFPIIIFDNKTNQNKWFIYKIEKINLYMDERSAY